MNPYYNFNFYTTWNKLNTCIIVSTGRTGTMFFEDFFNSNFDNVKALHEPHPDLFSLGTTSIRQHWSSKKIQRNLKYSRYRIYNEMIKHQQTYIESNNNIVLLLNDFLEVFPNTKVLHIIREPSSYIMSAFSKKHSESQYAIFDEKDPRKRLAATDYDDDPLINDWNSFDRFEKICWTWKKYNNIIEASASKNLYKLIKYENIFSETSGKESIEEIISFFDIKANQKVSDIQLYQKLKERKNHSSKYAINPPTLWDEKQKHFFRTHIAKESLRYGYELPF